MKKFKDFLYDNNDILIAFAILVVAAAIIIWRMSAIIEYPKAFIDDSASAQAAEEEKEQDAQSENDRDIEKDDGKDAHKDKDDNKSNEASAEKPEELWVNGTLSKAVNVTVSGDSAVAAVQCLVDVGLFKDYAEYQSACENLGIDHQKVSAGVFSFEKGSGKNDIARAINWS